jgi:2-polyprenyl-6-methoxyphenol hydroxylase-like FAD-dependent oxidoreductase
MGANVQRLVTENGRVAGVGYRGADGRWHEIRAVLTVAADGRFSKVRQLAGLEQIKTAPPMDVLWFRLPRRPDDPHDAAEIHVGRGHLAVLLDRGNNWQVGYVYPKGQYAAVKAEGIGALHRHLAETVPFLADRVDELKGWAGCAVLSVESGRLKRWYKPGLLLIGDAAHVMSPVAGVGINYAVQDAAEAADRLAGPLARGRVTTADLAAVQRRRALPTRLIQFVQGQIQRNVVATALNPGEKFRIPVPLRVLPRIPGLRVLATRLLTFGVMRPRVR